MILTRVNFLGVLKLLNVPIFLMAKFKLAVYVVSISLLNHTIRYVHSLKGYMILVLVQNATQIWGISLKMD